MPVEFLTDAKAGAYGRFPATVSDAQLAEYFHAAADEEAILERRMDHNRLGFAIQLGTVRFLGTFVADPAHVPRAVVEHVAAQLGIDDLSALERYWDSQTRWDHQAEIRRRYSYQPFGQAPTHLPFLRWLFARAWLADERPTVLFDRATAYLLEHKILLPGVTTLARLVASVRERAKRRLWKQLAARVDRSTAKRLESLLVVPEGSSQSTLESLRRGPVRASGAGLVDAICRVEQIRELGVADFDLAGLPEAVVRRLARYAAGAKAQNIARMPEPRRTGTLAAFASSLLTTATDDVLDVFDLLMGELRVKAEANAKRKRLQTLRDYDRAAIDLRSVVTVVLDALDDPGLDVRTAILARVTRDRLERAVETVARIARNPGDRYQTELLHRYATVRRYLPHFLRTLEFKGVPSARSTLDAVDFLRQAESQPYRHRFSAAEAPTEVIDRIWRTHVFEDDGTINRRAYTLAILGALRESLRRHDIFLESSFRWADPRAQLLSQVEWCDRRDEICAALGHELAPGVELAALADRLGRMFQLVGEGLEQNNSLAITASDGESSFSLSPLEAIDEPESLVALRLAVDSLMPRAELPEIILEVDAWTGFSLEFSHGSGAESRLEDLKASLCAVLVSQACNIGYRPLVRSNVAALTRERLNFVAANYVRTETLEAANARLVEHHAAQPLTELWGRGDIASVDGLRFVVPVQTINAGFNRRYFPARGVTWLNYMSDQFTGFYQLVVPGTLRDSLYILEGLLEHQTVLDPREVMSDSAGASEIIFALFWLLGYQFSPRLADVNDATFWRIDRNADYGSLNSLARKTVGTDRIAVHWDDLLRIAGSLQQGAVRAADLVRTLGSKAPTSTAKALRDLGRIIKTLFLLTYIDDVDYQQRIHAQLNRHESRHSLARALFHGERGQLRQKYREGQEDQLSALGLVVNIVVLWNTIYCQAALDRLRSAGSEVATADIARLSPLGHKHINFRGRYNVSHASTPAPGELRPLHGA